MLFFADMPCDEALLPIGMRPAFCRNQDGWGFTIHVLSRTRQRDGILLCAARLYERFNLFLLKLPEVAQLYRGQFWFPLP